LFELVTKFGNNMALDTGRSFIIMDKKLIGWCGLAFLDKTEEIEIGYGIAKEYWGRGFTTEAATASIRYGFEEARLNRIVAVAMPENITSRRVMEKIGMKFEKTGH